MPKLQVERIGGLAGGGINRSHLRSHGEVELAELSPAEQQAVEALFKSGGQAESSPMPDAFRYRISRATAKGVETVVAPEQSVPAPLRSCVKDELV